MNILFYTSFNLRSRDTESLMKSFIKQNHQVSLLTQSKPGVYHKHCSSYGVQTFAYEVQSKNKWLFVIKQWFFLIKFSRKHKIDIIYAHLENASMIAVLAQYFIKAKVLSCRHVVEEPHYLNSKNYLFQVKLVNALSRKIIVVSNRCRDFMIEVEKVKPSKIIVVNLAYDFNLYESVNKEKVNEIIKDSGGTLRFIMASRFIENKRPVLGLELVKRLKQEGLNVSLILLGNGPLSEDIAKYITLNNLENEVKLYGYVDNVLDYFSASHILLIPSITESSSVVLKEAGLAKITAIVCSDVGDAEDYLTSKEIFFVKKETFIEEAINISKAFISDLDSLSKMGESLSLKVKNRFSIENNIQKYDDLNTKNLTLKSEATPRIAFISSHIHKSLQFEWYQEELKKNHIYNIHIIINTMPDKQPLLQEELNKLGITCYVLNYKNTLSFFKIFGQIRKIIKRHKLNLIHTTLPYGNLMGQLAALSLGIRGRITTCENASWAFDYNSKKQMIIDKFTFWSAKKVISVADTANDFLLGKWGLDPDKVIQINHSLKFDEYEGVTDDRIKKLKDQLEIKESDFIVGMISRTEFWKGHEYALAAMQNIIKKHPDIKLLICGSIGFDHQKMLDLISLYKLENNVKFIGFVNDSVAFLKLIKVQIHVPINKYVENCGISIIEGMAARTPQLLTLSGYSFQSAKHLRNAYVVDYCNSKEIEEGIEYLYSNYDRALSFGKQAYQDALKDYTIEIKYQKHMDLYKSVLN